MQQGNQRFGTSGNVVRSFAPTSWGSLAIKPVTALLGGALVGATTVIYTISFFAIVFAGDLAAYVDHGLGATLIGAAVMAALGAMLFSYPGTVTHPQDVTAALLSVAAARIAVATPEGAADQLVGTVLVMIALTGIVAGLVSVVMGRAGLGHLIHAMPHPVVLGFLAATGVTLVLGSIGMLLGRSVTIWDAADLIMPRALVTWGPWLLIGAAIWALGRRLRSPAVLPLSIVATLAGYYAFLAATDLGLDGARAAGLTLTTAGGGGGFSHLSLAPLAAADWSLIAAEGPVLVAVVGLTVLGGLLNLTGVKHFTALPLDLDRDLQATGATNIVGAAFGGLVGYPALSTTFLGWRVGLRGIGAPLAAAASCAGVGIFGTELLSLLPIGIFAAIVGCLGLDLIVSSAHAARLRLGRLDQAIFGGVVLAAAIIGFLEAMALGVAGAVFLFLWNASRAEPLHARHTLASMTSCAVRAEPDMRRIAQEGSNVVVLQLSGHLFFGLSSRLGALADAELSAASGPPERILLDFSRVCGLDVSAALTLADVRTRCAAAGVGFAIAGLQRPVAAVLRRILPAETGGDVTSFRTLEDALWHIEEDLLHSGAEVPAAPDCGDLLVELARLHPHCNMLALFEQISIAAGERIIAPGASSRELFILLSGRASAKLPAPQSGWRLVARFSPGAVIGEIALYGDGKRRAEVRAETGCTLLRIDAAALFAPGVLPPEVLADFHRLCAMSMSLRLDRYMSFATESA